MKSRTEELKDEIAIINSKIYNIVNTTNVNNVLKVNGLRVINLVNRRVKYEIELHDLEMKRRA